MARRYFCTTGAVTAFFPSAFDGAGTTAAASYAASVWGAQDSVMLLGFLRLTPPAANDSLTLVDKAGNAVTPAITIGGPGLTSHADLQYLPDGGLPMPQGGFGVTTTQATSVYMFIVDIQKSVV